MRAFSALAVLSALSSALGQATLFINTPPSLVACQPALIAFGGGTAPYFITVLPAGEVSATPLESFPEQATAGTYTWNVDLAAGTALSLAIRDGTGALNYAAPLTIQAGTSSSCVNGGGASSALSSSAAASRTVASSAASVAASATGTGVGVVTPLPSASSVSGSAFVTSGAAATATGNVGPLNGTLTNSTEYNFTCSTGDLSYGITIANLTGVSLNKAKAFFAPWFTAAVGMVTNSSGSGVNATRSYSPGVDLTVDEVLLLNTTNATSLHQQWRFPAPTTLVLSPNLTAYDAFDDLTIYTNSTTRTTQIQYFILGCFDNQAAGAAFLAGFVEGAVEYYASALNATVTAANSTLSARRVVKLV